jgi:2'-5' RNA ligase
MTEPTSAAVGASAIIVEVPEAEPLVRPWRLLHDPSAAIGVPAHVTVLFPFVAPGRLDGAVDEAIRELAAEHRAFRVSFARVEAFDDVVWLGPEPDAPLRELTRAAWARFPEHPPYGGRFADVVPHLTVAQGDAAAVRRLRSEIERDLGGRLPFTAWVARLSLFVATGERWSRRGTYPLG